MRSSREVDHGVGVLRWRCRLVSTHLPREGFRRSNGLRDDAITRSDHYLTLLYKYFRHPRYFPASSAPTHATLTNCEPIGAERAGVVVTMDSPPPTLIDSVVKPTTPNPAGPPSLLLRIFINRPKDPATTRLLTIAPWVNVWDYHSAIERAFQWSHSEQYGFEIPRNGDTRNVIRTACHFPPKLSIPLADVFWGGP